MRIAFLFSLQAVDCKLSSVFWAIIVAVGGRDVPRSGGQVLSFPS